MNDSSQSVEANVEDEIKNDLTKERFRKLAKSQRILLLFILMFIPMIFSIFFLMASNGPPSLVFLAYLLIFVYIIYSYVHIILLAKRACGLGTAIICGLLLFFLPPLGYILLFFVNGIASGRLKGAGYKVGLLGVNPNAFK